MQQVSEQTTTPPPLAHTERVVPAERVVPTERIASTGEEPAAASPSRQAIRSLLLAPSTQEWLLTAYLVALLVRVTAGHGDRRPQAIECLVLDLVVFLGVVTLVRTGVLRPSRPTTLLHRVILLVPALGSFFQLQYILPTAGGTPWDGRLYALDLRVFGFEPAEAWDRFVTPATTEWFAFFYYGYFAILAIHVLPPLFFARDGELLRKLSFGFMWLYCVGHFVYTIVPAFGPYAFLGAHFQHPLDGTFWWRLVEQATSSVDEGSRTDVFPSLHTAVPTFLTLFSFLNRRRLPFKYTWIPMTFFTSQIILATMFLRWHYLIDIFGGLTLAASGLVAMRVAYRLDAARERAGGQPVWFDFGSSRS